MNFCKFEEFISLNCIFDGGNSCEVVMDAVHFTWSRRSSRVGDCKSEFIGSVEFFHVFCNDGSFPNTRWSTYDERFDGTIHVGSRIGGFDVGVCGEHSFVDIDGSLTWRWRTENV